MSVIEYVVTDKFVITVVKHHATNPVLKWANNYELYAATEGDTTNLISAANKIVAFERAMHCSFVAFDSCRISTWEPDSTPYDPQTFLNIPLTGVGATSPVGDAEPLTMTLSVVRQVSTGRLGHLFFRGVIGEGWVVSPAGVPAFVNPHDIDVFLQAAVDASSVDDLFGAGTVDGLSLAMITKTGDHVRVVDGFTVKGIAQLPLNHAWFNRTASSAPSS